MAGPEEGSVVQDAIDDPALAPAEPFGQRPERNPRGLALQCPVFRLASLRPIREREMVQCVDVPGVFVQDLHQSVHALLAASGV